MKNLLILTIIFIAITLQAYSQVISGKFIRFGADSVQIKTDTDILNLPIAKDIIVLDNNGQRVSPASLFENADITLNYEEGVVKSIYIDSQYINYIPPSKPEYQLIYRDTAYQYKNPHSPAKVSYVGYLPIDYQSISYPLVDIYKGTINYYSYTPPNYLYDSPMAAEIKFYNNLIASNYYSPSYYYETASSVIGSEIPNYYYISKIQEKNPYYYKQAPIKANEIYYATSGGNANFSLNPSNSIPNTNIVGIIVGIKPNTIIVSSDKSYEIELTQTSNILIKKEGKYIPLNNSEALNNLINKPVQLTITSNGDKLIANTIIINAQ